MSEDFAGVQTKEERARKTVRLAEPLSTALNFLFAVFRSWGQDFSFSSLRARSCGRVPYRLTHDPHRDRGVSPATEVHQPQRTALSTRLLCAVDIRQLLLYLHSLDYKISHDLNI